MLQKLFTLYKQKGQGIVEYAMILAFVAVVAIGLIGEGGLKEQVATAITHITAQFSIVNGQYTMGDPNDTTGNP